MTGGAGFIGSHVVARVLAEGHDVRALDNFSTGRRSNLAGLAADIELIEADIRELRAVRKAARSCDALLHFAAVPSVPRSIADPVTTHTVNANGTLNVLIAARDAEVGRVVFASSSSIYGASRALPKHESIKPLPISPYAVSKLAAENYCHSFYKVFGLETVALRYFNVFGPRQDPQSQYAAVVPRFIWAYRHGEPPVIFGDGEQSRDFTYVENVAAANLLAAQADGAPGQAINVAMGETRTLLELADSVAALAGRPLDREHVDARVGDVRMSLADVSKARALLGYEPLVGFDEGLRRTYESMAADDSLLPRISEARRWVGAAG